MRWPHLCTRNSTLVGICNHTSFWISWFMYQCRICKLYWHRQHQGHWAMPGKEAEQKDASLLELEGIWKAKGKAG